MKQLASNRTIRFVRTKAENGFHRTHLELHPGEKLMGAAPGKVWPLATFLHMSDLHVCDSQSPARVEFLDRYADPDYETRALIQYVGTYRAQEFLTLQVVEAMVRSLNEIEFGPEFSGKVDAVLLTGDVIDNGQRNELDWYQTLLHGGPVSSASGNLDDVEGVHSAAAQFDSEHYYQPDNLAPNRTGELFGMPARPGLARAAQEPFLATGLRHEWLAIHGNHDAMLQGFAMPTDLLQSIAVGSKKYSEAKTGVDPRKLFEQFNEVGDSGYPDFELLDYVDVTPDNSRRIIDIDTWVESHINCKHEHGISAADKKPYFFKDFGQVRLIALDSVNPYGGWQGCLDRKQLVWLENLLKSSNDKYVVLTSHHPLKDFVNNWSPDENEVPADLVEIEELLSNYPNVIVWIAGHVHDNKIAFKKSTKGDFGFWEVRTSSHIDWPQQARVLEIGKASDGRIVIATQVINHMGTEVTELSQITDIDPDKLADPVQLAGISRILAANDWQRFEGVESLENLQGQPEDRNIWLWLSDPLGH